MCLSAHHIYYDITITNNFYTENTEKPSYNQLNTINHCILHCIGLIPRTLYVMFTKHLMIAMILSAKEKVKRPEAYKVSAFKSSKISSIFSSEIDITHQNNPALINDYIAKRLQEVKIMKSSHTKMITHP